MSQQELITIPPQTVFEVFTTESAIDPFLARVRAQIDGFVPDVDTKKGRAEIASLAHKISQTKSHLEGLGKNLADIQKDIPKKIDATRRHLREELDRMRDEVRQPLNVWESAERARVARHAAEIERIGTLAGQSSTATEIRAAIADVEAVVIGPELEEYETHYARAKDLALRDLRPKLAERERLDAEHADLARLRREAEEQAARDRDERIRVAAVEAERARAEREAAAERDRIEAQAQAERDAAARREQELRDAAEADRRRAADAERRAAEAEQRAKDEAKAKADRIAADARRREEDAKRRAKVEGAAVAALVAGGIDEAVAQDVVALIARRAVPHVSIAY